MTDTATLTAGRELDALVAEKVMGWRREGKGWHTSPSHANGGSDWEGKGEHDVLVSPEDKKVWLCPCGTDYLKPNNGGALPAYSTDIAAAWTVYLTMMEKLFRQRQAFYAALQDEASRSLPSGERVAWPDVLTVLRKDFPAAICRAALATDGIL